MAKPKVASPSARVIKKSSCPTISGKSEITYCLGTTEDDQLMIRIHENPGGGFFSDEWVSMAHILSTLEASETDNGITSIALKSLFRGRSVNTPAFLMAALKAEGVIEPIEGKQRCHQLGDVQGFLTKAKQLQSSKPPRKTPARKHTPARKKAAPRAKK
ncbi:hypothetical protein FV139_17700 [Parahaliea maris]|uniref:Uncharacterized protein n=1 Tax=Parahaliea maris TaxID=2716870 RepID=A0A5C8ZQS2_9GAMM|nr:hypothetical protein [Parahaliea maris]TXS90808.1 hypothetical protein FV139_17700 [Parahaliea maris]